MAEAHVVEYGDLSVTALSPDMSDQLSGCWYTVSSGASAHNAFWARAELDQWLSVRGLALGAPLPDRPAKSATVAVIGRYRSVLHRDVERFDALDCIETVMTWNNFKLVPAKVTEDAAGVRTVHMYAGPGEFTSPRTAADDGAGGSVPDAVSISAVPTPVEQAALLESHAPMEVLYSPGFSSHIAALRRVETLRMAQERGATHIAVFDFKTGGPPVEVDVEFGMYAAQLDVLDFAGRLLEDDELVERTKDQVQAAAVEAMTRRDGSDPS